MVIKNAKKMKCISFFITTLLNLSKPCLEKYSKDSNKTYQLFVRIPYNSYFGKYLKKWYSWLQGRHLSWGSTSVNLNAVSQRLFQKTPPRFFFNLENFFRIDMKNNSWWIAQKILNKTFRQVLQRRGGGTGVPIEL